MSLSGVSGSAAGYNLVLSIASFMILLVNVNRITTMFCLNKIMRNILLVNTILICMMFYPNKHIYDIMIILIKSFLWIKLNMNLSNFLTYANRVCNQVAHALVKQVTDVVWLGVWQEAPTCIQHLLEDVTPFVHDE
jgi:hypothetical protein